MTFLSSYESTQHWDEGLKKKKHTAKKAAAEKNQ